MQPWLWEKGKKRSSLSRSSDSSCWVPVQGWALLQGLSYLFCSLPSLNFLNSKHRCRFLWLRIKVIQPGSGRASLKPESLAIKPTPFAPSQAMYAGKRHKALHNEMPSTWFWFSRHLEERKGNEIGEFSHGFAEVRILKWKVTDPHEELGKHKQMMLLSFLGKMRAFPRFDVYFHYKQVRVGRKMAGGVDSALSRLGLLEFVIL